MITYCAVKDGRAFTGSKEEVLGQVCSFQIDKYRRLFAHFEGYDNQQYHSYSDEYTAEEAHADAVNFLFSELSKHGYLVFHDRDCFGNGTN